MRRGAQPPPTCHDRPAGGAGPLPRLHLPALLPHLLKERAADEAQHGRDVHVADLSFRAGHREAAAEAIVPQVRLPVAFEDLAEDEEILLPAIGDEAVADLHSRLPRLHAGVGRLHRLAEAGLRRFERVEELNLQGHHPLASYPGAAAARLLRAGPPQRTLGPRPACTDWQSRDGVANILCSRREEIESRQATGVPSPRTLLLLRSPFGLPPQQQRERYPG